jgi:hypothetical protein
MSNKTVAPCPWQVRSGVVRETNPDDCQHTERKTVELRAASVVTFEECATCGKTLKTT